MLLLALLAGGALGARQGVLAKDTDGRYESRGAEDNVVGVSTPDDARLFFAKQSHMCTER